MKDYERIWGYHHPILHPSMLAFLKLAWDQWNGNISQILQLLRNEFSTKRRLWMPVEGAQPRVCASMGSTCCSLVIQNGLVIIRRQCTDHYSAPLHLPKEYRVLKASLIRDVQSGKCLPYIVGYSGTRLSMLRITEKIDTECTLDLDNPPSEVWIADGPSFLVKSSFSEHWTLCVSPAYTSKRVAVPSTLEALIYFCQDYLIFLDIKSEICILWMTDEPVIAKEDGIQSSSPLWLEFCSSPEYTAIVTNGYAMDHPIQWVYSSMTREVLQIAMMKISTRIVIPRDIVLPDNALVDVSQTEVYHSSPIVLNIASQDTRMVVMFSSTGEYIDSFFNCQYIGTVSYDECVSHTSEPLTRDPELLLDFFNDGFRTVTFTGSLVDASDQLTSPLPVLNTIRKGLSHQSFMSRACIKQSEADMLWKMHMFSSTLESLLGMDENKRATFSRGLVTFECKDNLFPYGIVRPFPTSSRSTPIRVFAIRYESSSDGVVVSVNLNNCDNLRRPLTKVSCGVLAIGLSTYSVVPEVTFGNISELTAVVADLQIGDERHRVFVRYTLDSRNYCIFVPESIEWTAVNNLKITTYSEPSYDTLTDSQHDPLFQFRSVLEDELLGLFENPVCDSVKHKQLSTDRACVLTL